MRAVVCHSLGDPSALQLEEVPSPTLGDDDVRIAVKAAGVNFPDVLMIQGKYQEKPDLPFIPGLEVAGEVTECGGNVRHLRKGQRIMAFAATGGGFASETVLPGKVVVPIPDAMDFRTAAAFPIVYGTAYLALAHRGALNRGETLLVLGATGGVGLAAIEIGKALGARVIAAARGVEKLKIAREHGADEVVDYSTEELRDRLKELTDGRGVDVVFDPVGGPAFHQCVRAIAWEGRILVVGFASGDIAKVATNLILVKNFSVIGVLFGAHLLRHPEHGRRDFDMLFEHYARGELKPRIHKTFPLADAASALAEITSRQVIGKMVLEI